MKEMVKLDPRQALVESYYKDPTSATFANLKQSMLRAGYSQNYADKHYSQAVRWIEQIKNTVEMIQGAERNLKKVIDKDIDISDDDKLSKSKLELLKIQQGASQFALKTLASRKYKEEQDKTDGAQINVNIIKQYNITNNGAPSTEPYPDAQEV